MLVWKHSLFVHVFQIVLRREYGDVNHNIHV